MDEKLIRCLAHTASGCLAPLCAAIGGFVAQEGIKALTGKFMPLKQWVSAEKFISLYPYTLLKADFTVFIAIIVLFLKLGCVTYTSTLFCFYFLLYSQLFNFYSA